MNATTPSPAEEVLPSERYWLYMTNLVLYAFELPISVFSALTVLSSSVLHPNLKLILVCQNACFSLFALSRTVQCLVTFAAGPNAWVNYKSIQCMLLFSTLYGNMIGHVLLLERLLATFFVKNYEHEQILWFPLCWFPLLFTFSLVNAYTETYQSARGDASLDITVGTILMLFLSLVMSFAEIFILSLMGVHNRKAYHQQRGQMHGKSLTERYQLSENIRTSRQLSPTFLFHFANICCTTSLGICMFWELVDNVLTLMAVSFWLNSLFNTVIELSVITRHPILRRNAKASLRRLFPRSWIEAMAKWNAKVGQQASCASDERGRLKDDEHEHGRQQPKTIDGQRLIHTPRPDDYFRILTESWGTTTARAVEEERGRRVVD